MSSFVVYVLSIFKKTVYEYCKCCSSVGWKLSSRNGSEFNGTKRKK